LAITLFDRSELGGSRPLRRLGWLAVALISLAAGFMCRGVLVGVAVPTLAVGLSFAFCFGSSERERFRDVCGFLCLLTGVCATAIGLWAFARALEAPEEFSLLVGSTLQKTRLLAAFDFVILQLGHGLMPYSAFVPFAAGCMLAPPPGVVGRGLQRQAALRSTLLLTAALGLGAYSWTAPYTGQLPFAPVFALSAMVGLALRDFERARSGWHGLALGVVAMALLLCADFWNFPEKALTPFAIDRGTLPESFQPYTKAFMSIATLVMVPVFYFALMERRTMAPRAALSEYARLLRNVRAAYSGNLYFMFWVGEFALIALALTKYLSDRYFQFAPLRFMPPVSEYAARWGFIILPLAVLVAPVGILLVRDGFRILFSPGTGLVWIGRTFPRLGRPLRRMLRRVPELKRFEPSRGAVALFSLAGFGLALSVVFYPALAAQISPKEAFEAYSRLSHSGEPLGMLGYGRATSASYYTGKQVPAFAAPAEAFEWLMQSGERRWLVARANHLAELNSMYRGRTLRQSGQASSQNLPVLDSQSSEILLVSNQLRSEEHNENPVHKYLPDSEPRPAHPVDATLADQLQTLGWEVRNLDGEVVDSVRPGTAYVFIIYYKVLATISGEWETFVHIDGYQRRFNADHNTLGGHYPFHLWRVGDWIADRYRFTLEPNFTPGSYEVFFGLFSGSRRLEVKRGRHQDNRIVAGSLLVR
jgi:hypothetical protein